MWHKRRCINFLTLRNRKHNHCFNFSCFNWLCSVVYKHIRWEWYWNVHRCDQRSWAISHLCGPINLFRRLRILYHNQYCCYSASTWRTRRRINRRRDKFGSFWWNWTSWRGDWRRRRFIRRNWYSSTNKNRFRLNFIYFLLWWVN